METSFDDVVSAVREGLEENFEVTAEQDWLDRGGENRDYVFEFTTKLLPASKKQREPRCRATVYTAPDGIEIEVIAAFYDPDFVNSQVLLQLCHKHHERIEAEFSIIHEYVEHKEKFTVEMRMFDFVHPGEGENFDPDSFEAFALFLKSAASHLFKK